jgi:hypothetical protein
LEVGIISDNFDESLNSEYLDSGIIYASELRRQGKICKELKAKGLLKKFTDSTIPLKLDDEHLKFISSFLNKEDLMIRENKEISAIYTFMNNLYVYSYIFIYLHKNKFIKFIFL